MARTNQSNHDGGNAADYTKTLHVQAPPHRLYEAVTTAPGIQAWWSQSTVAHNGDITVRFGGGLFQTLRLVDLVPDQRVVWEWIAQHVPVEGTTETDEWVGTKVTFDIDANPDGSSTLVFTHVGLTPQLACYDLCLPGWNFYLASLQRYFEDGVGSPYRERKAAEAERAWAEVEAAVAGLDPATLAAPGADGWSIKDHIVHLTAWDRRLAALLAGRPPAAALGLDEATYVSAGNDEINAHIRRAGAAKSIETVLAEWRQTRIEIRHVLDSLDEEALERRVADRPGAEPLSLRDWIHGIAVDHYAEHLAYIDRLTPARVGVPEHAPAAGSEAV